MLLSVSLRCYTKPTDRLSPIPTRVPDSAVPSTEDAELRAHVEQALSATYELDQEIGRGGMGIVYRAKDKRLKRFVAIKLLPPELSFRRDIRTRFLREAETAAQLSHPNIVPIYSVDEVGNLVFFVMACIDGDNLATKLQKRGPLPIDDVRRWLLEVADALAFAHARGVIHRDIKPDNILLDSIDGRALVTDFGIARAASDSGETSRLTATGIAIGTPAYMSPEQASGDRDLDARSDLYSLGATVYHLLAGRPPYSGPSAVAVVMAHIKEPLPPLSSARPDLPAGLCEIVDRLLAKQPTDRFESPQALLKAVDQLETAMFAGTRTLPSPLAWPEGEGSWAGAATRGSTPLPMQPGGAHVTNPRLRDATVHLRAAADREREQRAERETTRRRWGVALLLSAAALAAGFAIGRSRPRRSQLFGVRR